MHTHGEPPPNPYTTPGPGRTREPWAGAALSYGFAALFGVLAFIGWVLSWLA